MQEERWRELGYCCEAAWREAAQKAWKNRALNCCKCDHNDYCECCYPPMFREGGKFYGFSAAKGGR